MAKKLLFFLSIAILGCNHNPYKASNKIYKKETKAAAKLISQKPADYFPYQDSPWIGTVNFDLRKPNFVIIHHMLSDYLRAWQAGQSRWGNNSDINSSSVGIELDNNGFEIFTEPQIRSLLVLLDTLKIKYKIPQENFIGHGDIAPGRKVDPNWRFPWKTLADHGYGDWYSDTTGMIVPARFNNNQALRIIGYNMKDSVASIAAFRRHWMQDSVYKPFDSASVKILYGVYLKYQ